MSNSFAASAIARMVVDVINALPRYPLTLPPNKQLLVGKVLRCEGLRGLELTFEFNNLFSKIALIGKHPIQSLHFRFGAVKFL